VIIIGIDPGTAITGYGVINRDMSGFLTCIEFGCIKTDKHLTLDERLSRLRLGLEKVIRQNKPTLAGVEKLFFTTNAKTAISVAHARGVCIETLFSSGAQISEFTPLQVKQAVTGYGKADKTQVQKMVKLLLKLDEPPRPDDAADALAVAICCAHTSVYS